MPDYWKPTAPLVQQESLARFVRYDDPAINQPLVSLNRTVSGYVGQPVFRGAINGSTPEIIDAEVAAVYDYFALVHQPQLHSVGAPPNELPDRQLIRSPTDLAQGRVGNCIDIVCFMAACLWRMDHSPLVVVYERRRNDQWLPFHAMLGYLRGARPPGPQVMNRSDLQNLQGIPPRFVEATGVFAPNLARPQRRAFSEALFNLDNSEKHATKMAQRADPNVDLVRVSYAVDVRRAYGLRTAWRPFGQNPGAPVNLNEIANLLESHGKHDFAMRVRKLTTQDAQTICSDSSSMIYEIVDAQAKRLRLRHTQPIDQLAALVARGIMSLNLHDAITLLASKHEDDRMIQDHTQALGKTVLWWLGL